MANAYHALHISQQREFLSRVNFFAVKAAVAVMSEPVGTANHAERVVWAKSELAGTNPTAEQSKSVATNATIQAALDDTQELDNVSDADIEFAVNSLVNAWAGVST